MEDLLGRSSWHFFLKFFFFGWGGRRISKEQGFPSFFCWHASVEVCCFFHPPGGERERKRERAFDPPTSTFCRVKEGEGAERLRRGRGLHRNKQEEEEGKLRDR